MESGTFFSESAGAAALEEECVFFSTLSFFWPKSRELVFGVFFFSIWRGTIARFIDSLFRVCDVLYTYLSYACYPTSYNWGKVSQSAEQR